MADTIPHNSHGDGSLSSAKHANPNASFELPPAEADKGYEVVGN
jgi:hypothetical protein